MVLVCSLYSAVSYAGSSDVTPFEPIPVMSAKLGYQISLDDNNVRSDSSLVGLYAGMQLDPSWIWDVGVQYHNDQDLIMLSSIHCYSIVESVIPPTLKEISIFMVA